MWGWPRGTGRAVGAVVLGHGRQQTQQRDPPAGERVGPVGYRLGHEQTRPRVADRVLGVLGHEADEEERVPAIVEAVAGNRAVRVALRIGGKRGERPRLAEATRVRQRSACDGSGGGGPPGRVLGAAPPSSPVGTWCPVGRSAIRPSYALTAARDRGDSFVLPASAYAETLVRPAGRGAATVARVDSALDAMAIVVADAYQTIARRAATLRPGIKLSGGSPTPS